MSYDEAADFVKKNVVCALDVYYSWVKVPRAVNVRVFWNHLRWDLWPEEQAITGVRPIDLNDPLELERVVRVITRYDKGQFSFDFNKVLFKNKYHSRGGYALPSQKKPLF
jgi:hypothetical protein